MGIGRRLGLTAILMVFMLGVWAPAAVGQETQVAVADRLEILRDALNQISRVNADLSDPEIRPSSAVDLEELYLRVREQERRAAAGQEILRSIQNRLSSLRPLPEDLGDGAQAANDTLEGLIPQLRRMDDLLASMAGFEAALRSRDQARIGVIAAAMLDSARLGLDGQALQLRTLSASEPADSPARQILMSQAIVIEAATAAMEGSSGRLSLTDTRRELMDASAELTDRISEGRQRLAEQRRLAADAAGREGVHLLRLADLSAEIFEGLDDAKRLISALAVIAGGPSPSEARDQLRERGRAFIELEGRITDLQAEQMELEAAILRASE